MEELQLFSTYVLLSLSVALIILALFHDFQRTYLTRTGSLLNKLPGKARLPFLGHAHLFIGSPCKTQQTFTNYVKTYGKVSRLWGLGAPYVLVSDASVCEKILGSDDLFEKAAAYDHINYYAGVGLVTSTGELWKKDRKSLNHAFDKSLFNGFVKIFNQGSRILTMQLETRFKDNKNPQNLYTSFLSAAMDMIFQAGLGTNLHIQDEGHENIYASSLSVLTNGTHNRLFKPHMTAIPFLYRAMGYLQAEKKAYAVLFEACNKARNLKEISDLKEKHSSISSSKPKSFIEILMEWSPPPTPKEYCDHLLTIIGAGAETTGSSIYGTLFYLALNPEHQARVHEEIDAIIGSHGDNNNVVEITLSDLAEAKYLEMCWKESMRIKPPVPIIGRRLTKDVILDDGRILPCGANVLIDIYDMHRDPDVFTNPTVFDPLRFSAEACTDRHAYSYLPFSIGNRNCIGLKYAQLEAKTTLIHVLRKFKVTTKQNPKDIKIIFGVPGIPFPQFEIMLEARTVSY